MEEAFASSFQIINLLIAYLWDLLLRLSMSTCICREFHVWQSNCLWSREKCVGLEEIWLYVLWALLVYLSHVSDSVVPPTSFTNVLYSAISGYDLEDANTFPVNGKNPSSEPPSVAVGPNTYTQETTKAGSNGTQVSMFPPASHSTLLTSPLGQRRALILILILLSTFIRWSLFCWNQLHLQPSSRNCFSLLVS